MTNDELEEKTESESKRVKKDLKMLFPDEYQYIENYEKNGVVELEEKASTGKGRCCLRERSY